MFDRQIWLRFAKRPAIHQKNRAATNLAILASRVGNLNGDSPFEETKKLANSARLLDLNEA